METGITVLTFDSCTKCVGGPFIIHDRMPSFLGMDDLTTVRRFDLQATWAINVPGFHFDMLLVIGVCTTRHCRASD